MQQTHTVKPTALVSQMAVFKSTELRAKQFFPVATRINAELTETISTLLTKLTYAEWLSMQKQSFTV